MEPSLVCRWLFEVSLCFNVDSWHVGNGPKRIWANVRFNRSHVQGVNDCSNFSKTLKSNVWSFHWTSRNVATTCQGSFFRNRFRALQPLVAMYTYRGVWRNVGNNCCRNPFWHAVRRSSGNLAANFFAQTFYCAQEKESASHPSPSQSWLGGLQVFQVVLWN